MEGENDERLIWCSSCMNWKPDRAHHCRELDRCVLQKWIISVLGYLESKIYLLCLVKTKTKKKTYPSL